MYFTHEIPGYCGEEVKSCTSREVNYCNKMQSISYYFICSNLNEKISQKKFSKSNNKKYNSS